MKTITITATLTAFATIVLPRSAHAQVKKLEEERCLHFGSYAEHVAEGMGLRINGKTNACRECREQNSERRNEGHDEQHRFVCVYHEGFGVRSAQDPLFKM